MVMEALAISEKMGLARYISEQPPYNLLDRRIENELVPLARSTAGAAALVAAGGRHPGRALLEETIPEDSRADAPAACSPTG
jgi:1-deoxyxylulose-5-phosphate synthase